MHLACSHNMALHPSPSPTMLMPLMHPNSAQIARVWAAKTILTNNFDISPFETLPDDPHITITTSAESQPTDLISWHSPALAITQRTTQTTVSQRKPLRQPTWRQPLSAFLERATHSISNSPTERLTQWNMNFATSLLPKVTTIKVQSSPTTSLTTSQNPPSPPRKVQKKTQYKRQPQLQIPSFLSCKNRLYMP